MLTSLANHYAFDIETPFEKLPQTMQEVVLNGSGKEQIPFNYLNERGTIFQRSHSFEGILHNLQRRYHEDVYKRQIITPSIFIARAATILPTAKIPSPR